jgi:hypothetical protein
MWIYYNREVMAMIISYIKTETLLDELTDELKVYTTAMFTR